MKKHPLDPKGLILESYRIEGIAIEECRSIFLDWALSAPMGQDMSETLNTLLAYYAQKKDVHPMTVVMKEGLAPKAHAKRRGGWRARERKPE